jgi:hypothetical protein
MRRLPSSPRLGARLWPLALLLLVAAQWGVVAWIASAAQHSGWLYGDPAQTETLHAAARAVVHGHLPGDGGGFLWPVLTAPFAAAGSSPSAGLAALVLLQVVVLLPLALLAVVGTVERLAGRSIATLAGVVWILLPPAAYHYSDFRMRPALLDRFLPQAFGLAETTAFPAMVAVAASAYLLVRSLASSDRRTAAGAGLTLSVAGALAIPSLLFLPGALAALALRRRWRGLAAFAAATVPGLLAAALWYLHAPHAGAPLLHWSWSQFHFNLQGFREYYWSLRVIEWLPVAGTIALFRHSVSVALAIGAWFWTTVLLRGAVAGTFSTSDSLHPSSVFLLLLLTALPAFATMIGALPLLIPRLPARVARGRLGGTGPDLVGQPDLRQEEPARAGRLQRARAGLIARDR